MYALNRSTVKNRPDGSNFPLIALLHRHSPAGEATELCSNTTKMKRVGQQMVKEAVSKRTKKESKTPEVVSDFLGFLHKSPSHFHAVHAASSMLQKAGFVEISESDTQAFKAVKPNGKYFYTRNQSSIISFAVGGKWKPGNGFNIMGAHTDSPVLKLKPNSAKGGSGYKQVGVECYGGGLWHTWFDRDLSVAGRVIVADDKGGFQSRLVDLEEPVLRIPMLAIHLNRDIYEKGLNPNKETHLVPVLATATMAELNKPAAATTTATKQEAPEPHDPVLIHLLCEKLEVEAEQIRDFELCLYDTQPAALNGAFKEFIVARGLDNLCMSFVCLTALIESCSAASLEKESQIRVVALFDNEEIGSTSAYGANGAFLPELLSRLNKDPETLPAALRKSFMVSADMAHAVHPNYSDMHEKDHRPQIHKGLVVKENVNQRYATTGVTKFFLGEIARRHEIPLQKFCVRQDMGCGSTIGPMLSANTGIRTVDVGIPQLAMHSIRETCGTSDLESTARLFTAFFQEFAELDKVTKVD
eukprot:g21831.t1